MKGRTESVTKALPEAIQLHNLGIALLQRSHLEESRQILAHAIQYLNSNQSLRERISQARQQLALSCQSQVADVRVWNLENTEAVPCAQTTYIIPISLQTPPRIHSAIILYNFATIRELQGDLGDAWHNYAAAKDAATFSSSLTLLILQAMVRIGPRLYRSVHQEQHQLDDLLRRRHHVQPIVAATAARHKEENNS